MNACKKSLKFILPKLSNINNPVASLSLIGHALQDSIFLIRTFTDTPVALMAILQMLGIINWLIVKQRNLMYAKITHTAELRFVHRKNNTSPRLRAPYLIVS